MAIATGAGRLKIFLGYSSGVGKSFRMLDEGRRRRERGQDVVVGAVQPFTVGAAADVLQQLPVIPLREAGGGQGMDVEAILQRRPEICLVDGLAYDNPPGAPRQHRWQDVEYLLTMGISVIATINLQFIAERQDEVERITGKRPAQSVPERLLLQADEIEIVDAPPAAEGGRGEAQRRQLSALRELALLQAADVVDRQLENYLTAHGIEAHWGTQERILVCVTPYAPAQAMIESGQRNADRFRGELIVAYVRKRRLPPAQQQELDANLERGRAARAEIVELAGPNFVDAILPFARNHGITQIFLGHSTHRRWWLFWRRTSLDRLIRDAEGLDVRVFPH